MVLLRYKALALLLSAPAIVLGLSVGDRFQIDLASRENGGCGWATPDVMNNLITESFDLAKAGLQAVEDYTDEKAPEASRLLDTFFNTSGRSLTRTQLGAIKAAFVSVRNWLENGGPVNDGRSNQKPWLFCHHTWLEKQQMTDVARDINGKDITYKSADGSLNLLSIEGVEEYRNQQKTEQEALQEIESKMRAVPYWSKKHGSYLFDLEYASSPSSGFCTPVNSNAATQHRTPSSTITLCPRSFGTTNSVLSNKGVTSLRSIQLQPTQRGDKKSNKSQSLQEILPTSTTLFHELFHLVLGIEKTIPPGGERYQMSQMMDLGFADASANAENYAVVAVAYYLTLNHGKDNNGNRVEFFSGYVTQG